MKFCSKCRSAKDPSEFTRDKGRKDGLNPRCKSCTRSACAVYQKANPDTAKARGQAWVKANPGRQRERTRAYYDANAEKMAKWHADYNERNRAKILAKAKAKREADPAKQKAKSAAWYAANKGHALAKWAAREARKLQATPAWASREKVAAFYKGAEVLKLFLGQEYHVDHIVPLRSPYVCGLHNEFNLQLLPPGPNKSKGNRFWPGMWGQA